MNEFQTSLSRYLSDDQLKKIRGARVCLAGAGGLGSNVAVILARTGFEDFEILDRDVIEPSNLNRQDYTFDQIGQSKVECLRKRLLAINPAVHVVIHQAEWTPANAGCFFNGARILIEAFDKAAIKTSFVEWASHNAEFVVTGNGMAGLKMTDVTAVRKFNNIYFVGDATADIHEGAPPLAPRVLQCSAKMAEIVLALTLGIYKGRGTKDEGRIR